MRPRLLPADVSHPGRELRTCVCRDSFPGRALSAMLTAGGLERAAQLPQRGFVLKWSIDPPDWGVPGSAPSVPLPTLRGSGVAVSTRQRHHSWLPHGDDVAPECFPQGEKPQEPGTRAPRGSTSEDMSVQSPRALRRDPHPCPTRPCQALRLFRHSSTAPA
jgi:hypothetical protein